MTSTITLFLALLAVAAEVTVAAGLVVAAVGGRHGRSRLRRAVGSDAIGLALVVATVSTGGSLWLSYGAHFQPCTLCWYQRICMYPLVVILGLGILRRDANVRLYAAVMAAVGLGFSLYHILVEHFPSLEGGVCERTNPCTLIWVRRFGYLTIPTMAASAFALILSCAWVARPSRMVST